MKRNESYRKSHASNSQGACVEVGQEQEGVGVGDTQDPYGPLLKLPAGTWRGFVIRLRSDG